MHAWNSDLFGPVQDKLGDEAYVGLFVCSHDTEVIERAVFRDVRITVPAAEDFIPYREYLGSRLETLDVDTGDRQVLCSTLEGIEAPNWTPDGTTLIYNSKGRLFRFPLAEKTPVPLDTGFANHCNNDHVLSFDGQTLGISHHPKEAGSKSVIYTLPAAGGEPKRVTTNAPSYLHDWFPHVSPDGKRVVFLSFSKDVPADKHPFYKHIYLRVMPIDGGEPQVIAYLYGGQGTINIPSWSPDSRHLAFVSNTGQ